MKKGYVPPVLILLCAVAAAGIVAAGWLFFKPMHKRLWTIILFDGFLVFSTAAFVGHLWRQRHLTLVREKRKTECKLWESETRFRGLADNTALGIAVMDTRYKIAMVNRTFSKLFGKSPDNFAGKQCYKEFEKRDAICRHCPGKRAMASGKTEEVETEGVRDDGSRFWVHNRVIPLWGSDGELSGFMEIVEDIGQRKRADQLLRQFERELTFRNRINEAFLTVSDDQVYAKVLQTILAELQSPFGIFGYINKEGGLVCASMTKEVWDCCRMPGKDIIFPREQWGGIWGQALMEQKTFLANELLHTPKGHVPIFRAIAVPIIQQTKTIGLLMVANKAADYDPNDAHLLEKLAGVISPILHTRLAKDHEEAERQQAEKNLRESLAEKEVLLKEVHHRVRNNLQVIDSVLGLQAERIENKNDLAVFLECRTRVCSIAMVHSCLCQSNNLSAIDLSEYIQRITRELLHINAVNPEVVSLHVDADEELLLPIDKAVPCGMILSELLTNALKYAFPNNREGQINIEARNHRQNAVTLVVADNGVGFPKDFDFQTTKSLGLQLVRRLVGQLKGSFQSNIQHGSRFTIRFPLGDLYKEAKQ